MSAHYTIGCTDPGASNFNSSATIDDGSCVYAYGDEWIINDPADNSTFDNDQGDWGVYGTGTITWGSSYGETGGGITYTPPNGEAAIQGVRLSSTNLTPLVAGRSYLVSASIKGATGEGSGFRFKLGGAISVDFNVTTSFVTYSKIITVTANTQLEITNVNTGTNAWFLDNVSIKEVGSSCIPDSIPTTITKVSNCMRDGGTRFLLKLQTGITDTCSDINLWKMILVQYLLSKKGLACIYNCQDLDTPAASSSSAYTVNHLNKFINFIDQQCDDCGLNAPALKHGASSINTVPIVSSTTTTTVDGDTMSVNGVIITY